MPRHLPPTAGAGQDARYRDAIGRYGNDIARFVACYERDAIRAMPEQTKVNDRNPNAVRHARALGAATGLKNLGVHLMTVLPGHEASEFHRHLFEEECYCILEGGGDVTLGDERFAVAQGDFIGLPADGKPHTLFNNGSAPLLFLLMRHNLVQDVCDYPRCGKRLYVTGDEEAFVDLREVIRLT
jgi:uncharacterized cupin superfamily protein